MDNIINPPQLLTPLLNVQNRQVNVQIPELPPQLSVNLPAGRPLLLNLLINSNNGVFIEAEVVSGGQKIPLQMQMGQPLQLETGNIYQAALKETQTGSWQLLSVNGQKPENFLVRTPAANTSVVTENMPSAANPAAPFSSITFQPLKTAPLLDNLMQEMNFPQPLREQVLNNLPTAEIIVAVKNLSAAPQMDFMVLEPLKNTLRQILQTGGDAVKTETLLQQLRQEVSSLGGQSFNAVVASRPSASTAVFSSPLGKLIADTPVKLELDKPLMLEVEKVLSLPLPETPRTLLENIVQVWDKLGLEKIFPRFDIELLKQETDGPNHEISNLLKIFEPLQGHSDAADLTLRILQKLPSFNKNMLSNMHAFFKAAQNRDASVWLGPEISSALRSHSVAGSETVSRLDNYVSSGLKEGVVWRLVEIPFFDGSQIVPVKIALKKDPPEKEPEQKKNSGVRFLVDTEFSQLGKFQFDGFSIGSERRFDLVIRTSRLQSGDFCSHVINLFKKSLYDVGYIGKININQRESFIKVDADLPEPMKQGVYV